MPSSFLVTTTQRLEALAERARAEKEVALDTEFMWERTYFPKLCLVPLAFRGGDSYMVDVIAVKDLSALGEVVQDPTIQKVLHDAEQDLVCLRRATGTYPRNVFDTQLAAGFGGMVSTISLQGLLRDAEVAELAKTETRTNWLKRPLSEKQLVYAMDDVRHLIATKDTLVERARERGHEAWLRAEMATYDDPERYEERDPGEQFRRVKGSGRVRGKALAVLRDLAAWREEEARRLDRPRGHVLSDELLIVLSNLKDTSAETFAKLDKAHRRVLKRHGPGIVNTLALGLLTKSADYPKMPPPPVNRTALKKRTDQALERIREACALRGLDPILVAPRAMVSSLLGGSRDEQKHSLLKGWRGEFLHGILDEFMTGPA